MVHQALLIAGLGLCLLFAVLFFGARALDIRGRTGAAKAAAWAAFACAVLMAAREALSGCLDHSAPRWLLTGLWLLVAVGTAYRARDIDK